MQEFNEIVAKMNSCNEPREKYSFIMKLSPPTFNNDNYTYFDTINVPGCQSKMDLSTYSKNDQLYFSTISDALISRGLGVIACAYFSGKSPESIIKDTETVFKELNLDTILSPSRSNGFYSLVTSIKQSALKTIMNRKD